MVIKFKNFLIEYDRYGYILSELAIATKGDNIGQEYVIRQTYPSTLDKCFERILHSVKKDARGTITITQLIPELKKIDKQFKEDLQELIKQINI